MFPFCKFGVVYIFVSPQVLTKREPVDVPEYWKERTNPIRRFYQAPLNGLLKVLTPVLVSYITRISRSG